MRDLRILEILQSITTIEESCEGFESRVGFESKGIHNILEPSQLGSLGRSPGSLLGGCGVMPSGVESL